MHNPNFFAARTARARNCVAGGCGVEMHIPPPSARGLLMMISSFE
jgi:hypothetical protein